MSGSRSKDRDPFLWAVSAGVTASRRPIKKSIFIEGKITCNIAICFIRHKVRKRTFFVSAACCLFFGTSAQSLSGYGNSENRPRNKQKISLSPRELAKDLVKNCTTDEEKVRALYIWITDNISYMIRPVKNRKVSSVNDDDTVYRTLDERIAISVLEKRVAVCEGYSRLFKTLCHYAGLKAEIIHGYANGGRTPSRFGSNHTWNAVQINNEWKLLDLTWAAGYVTWKGDMFVQERDENYFLPSPRQFIRDHYPDDINWTLLQQPPVVPEFQSSPFLQRSFSKYRLNSFSPAAGIIEAGLGDVLYFELRSNDIIKDRQVGADPFLDTNAYITDQSVVIRPAQVNGNITRYKYEVSSEEVEWLYILYNDDLVLRYRLKVRSPLPAR